MNIDALESLCERALRHTFSKSKICVCAAALCFCGLFVIFSMGLSLSASPWVAHSLAFLPLFISSSVLIALGIVLIRGYHNEIKQKPVPYWKIITDSWEVLLSSSYCFFPFIAAYLIMWVVLGLFFLLREIPLIGDFFGVVLAFGPFLLMLGSFVLLMLCVFMLFTLAPLFALRSFPKNLLVPHILAVVKDGLLHRLVFLVLAAIPVAAISALLWQSAKMTAAIYFVQESHMQMILQWFFIMPPFALVLAFPVTFFFNMAAEAHIAIQKRIGTEKIDRIQS